ncbi:MAG: response regulator transcription factor [bacterium]
MNKISIMIVDDHQVVREGLRQLLELEPDITVVAEAVNGLDCLSQLENLSPTIIFMDISMSGINGIETTRLISQKYPSVKVIMLTIFQDEPYVMEAIQAGARGYVLKDVKRQDLIRIVHHVVEDRAFIDPVVAGKLFRHVKQQKGETPDLASKPQLTHRELEVLVCLVDGKKDREISTELFISDNTVRSHIKNLYKKLGVSSRSQAVAWAIRNHIVSNTG